MGLKCFIRSPAESSLYVGLDRPNFFQLMLGEFEHTLDVALGDDQGVAFGNWESVQEGARMLGIKPDSACWQIAKWTLRFHQWRWLIQSQPESRPLWGSRTASYCNARTSYGNLSEASMIHKAVKHLKSIDPVLEKLVVKIGPVGLKATRLPVFQSLVQAIIYQQLNGKAADTILGRFGALFGDGPFPFAAQVLSKQPEQLRSAGLSKPKANYIRGIAEKAAFGSLPTLEECDKLTDAEILQRLTEMKGVGRWTVEMFLIFNLGRLDVLPIHDLGVRRGFQIAYGKRKMPEPEQLERSGEKWRPYRTVAARYLWRAVDSV
jgi:3-methyladenine DNA glycosylase/8-oxoguanine DNA glycosylase